MVLSRGGGGGSPNGAEDVHELVDFRGREEAFNAVWVDICVRGLVVHFGIHAALPG